MHDFWPDSGYRHLERTPGGWLRPTAAYLRTFLDLAELALVEESTPGEIALHHSLHTEPLRVVAPAELEALEDADVGANYAMFLAFRDALLAAGTLEAYYLGVMRSGAVSVAPRLLDRIVEAIVRHLLDAGSNAFEARAGELLFRAQRLTINQGRMLAADLQTLDELEASSRAGKIGPGPGDEAAVPALDVLTPENAFEYWERSPRHDLVLDLTHELKHALSHGLDLKLARANSGLKALSRVLEKWLAHLLGRAVTITPLPEINDPAWRWHVGLDAESMALLNDLYEGIAVDSARMQRLVSLFRLDFADRADVRAEMAGKPVYLGLAMTADGTLRLKPQNLLLNLPLAPAA